MGPHPPPPHAVRRNPSSREDISPFLKRILSDDLEKIVLFVF